ncbi:hypothetical protein HETIRDRAFT_327946 [Heterobasidion irregulare TC 32-1]|uniref:Uncharacterized protein n=1 Tax=Heterobasidion irregulare (strain TC 32-1) TaxID=747525 RepID=W4JT78_HETIT|nr:uncharacterized protein HETIRDRAFT_327946 [Heterobasidion irregulare TC 32-1]ETW76767.1 hypothetical protein HETIRDRAFT_327946 [Heterobasidion irregulare TC 32-1]
MHAHLWTSDTRIDITLYCLSLLFLIPCFSLLSPQSRCIPSLALITVVGRVATLVPTMSRLTITAEQARTDANLFSPGAFVLTRRAI